MKYLKILTLIIFFFCISYSASAVENGLQNDDENLIRGVINSPIGRLSRHHACLKIDYISYQIRSGKTVYSQILELENKYKNEPDNVNSKYTEKLKDLYMFLASYNDEESMNAEFLQKFNEKKIVIPNEEYSLLDNDLRILLSVVNVFN